MFRNRIQLSNVLRAALPTVALVALGAGTATCARADVLKYQDDGDGLWSVWVYDDDLNLKSIHMYDEENRYIGSVFGNPSPGGGGTGLGPDKDAIDAAIELAKSAGAPYTGIAIDPLATPVGLDLGERGKIPGAGVTDPPPGLYYPDQSGGVGGGGGGFDPGVPIRDQIPGQRGSGGDDDDDDGPPRRPDPADAWDFDPDVIDPAPEGFVLLPPSMTGHGSVSATPASPNSPSGLTGFGQFGGGFGATPVRPGATAITGGR